MSPEIQSNPNLNAIQQRFAQIPQQAAAFDLRSLPQLQATAAQLPGSPFTTGQSNALTSGSLLRMNAGHQCGGDGSTHGSYPGGAIPGSGYFGESSLVQSFAVLTNALGSLVSKFSSMLGMSPSTAQTASLPAGAVMSSSGTSPQAVSVDVPSEKSGFGSIFGDMGKTVMSKVGELFGNEKLVGSVISKIPVVGPFLEGIGASKMIGSLSKAFGF